jgi:hypothetical protein
VVKDNIVDNETEAPSIGILITHDKGDANRSGRGAGDPDDVLLTGNILTGNKEVIRVDGGTEIIQQNNHINKD